MKMFAMRPLVAAAVLWLFPLLCTAAEMEMESESEMATEEELVDRSEKKEAFTPKECLAVVKKVQESGRYTEESIVPICNDVMGRSSNCEFFAEALSLASSHSDFKGEHFCEDMDRAQFCSEIMDKLLQSTAVSDLAFGECERAKPNKSIEYCRRIQNMLGLSVKQEDLDTMRACYMMEAYTNQTGSKALEANEASPQMRIITGGNKELDTAGKGGGPGHPPKESNIGRPDIVLQPTPLENFGKGKGNITKPKGIVAEPEKAGGAPAPAQAQAPAEAPKGPILAEPIPAPPQEKSTLQTSSSKVSAPPAKPAVVQQTVAHASAVSAVVATNRAVPAPRPQPAALHQQSPVILEAKVVMSTDTKQSVHPMLLSQPMVAQAIMQNGTLVMTGTPFGSVKVDGSAIVEALRKQSAVPKGQVLAIAQATAVKPVAPRQAAAPKQASAVKTTPAQPVKAQPAKAKVGLVVVEPPHVKPAAPVAQAVVQPPAAVAQPPVAVVQPAATVAQPTAVVAQPAVTATPVAAKVPATVPAQPVIKIVLVAPQPPAKVAPPPQAAPQAPAPRVVVQAPQPAKQPATQPIIQAVLQVQPVAATQPAAAPQESAPQPVAATPVKQVAKVVAAAKPAPKAVVAAKPAAKAPLKQAPNKAAPAAKDAKLRSVSKHTAGLAQKHSKVDAKEKKEKKSEYAGFLSKFVAYY